MKIPTFKRIAEDHSGILVLFEDVLHACGEYGVFPYTGDETILATWEDESDLENVIDDLIGQMNIRMWSTVYDFGDVLGTDLKAYHHGLNQSPKFSGRRNNFKNNQIYKIFLLPSHVRYKQLLLRLFIEIHPRGNLDSCFGLLFLLLPLLCFSTLGNNTYEW